MGFDQQVMFANTSDWRFDKPGENRYVEFVENATTGDIDKDYYDRYVRPVKMVSDKWWMTTVKLFAGALPVSLCKYWGELMGMAGGHVRQPLSDLPDEQKRGLKRELEKLGY
jgi:dihydrodipicolinate synthase/N-acetylneuraminate lyase